MKKHEKTLKTTKTVFQKGSKINKCPKTIKVTEVDGTVLENGKNPLFPKNVKKRQKRTSFYDTFVGRWS